MKKSISVLFLGLCAVMMVLFVPVHTGAQEAVPSSTVSGLSGTNNRESVQTAFVNGINHWLRRYEPALVQRTQNRVLMTADYDYLVNIELSVTGDQYTITVTVAEERYSANRAQKICERISAGVNRAMLNYLARNKQG